ncbi:Molybdenum cofactor biosynthesis protein B [Paraliobacillus sp. PM-2]|uniref:MogA/MoaB family molybdenum cofactor biosynthesis protein n=1 Tax=Paraliobacillus sp. PM-2 TaxID=1462524 RepID=UPI00061C200A|nr:MogA/MoaB family molybdenum cofactor biosynthesis protein [Paraliobacillus sp. PM-2]CQR47344.1 Molybdenum cofactor biosynthesis protein B [Paraliobacillus sp. PM-2]
MRNPLHPINQKTIACNIITVTDTRTKDTDKSGKKIMQFLRDNNHQVINYQLVKDEQEQIQKAIEAGLNHPDVQVILLNGGTGIAKRDVTIEVVEQQVEKELPGFGELFRYLSYQYDIGSSAILSRAMAGVVQDTAIFAMPGSTGAVMLAMERLIIPELKHVVSEIMK